MTHNYKIVDTTIPHFLGITVDLDFDELSVGDSYNLFGNVLNITQKGDTVVALSNKTQVFVLQKMVEAD